MSPIMAPKKKTSLSKEDLAKKKSEQAKKRLGKIHNDPVLLAEYREKERLKYLKKKEKGKRKCVKDMTPREHRAAKKKWVAYSADYRKKQNIHNNAHKNMKPNTPPSSDEENIPEAVDNDRRVEARKRSILHRKKRNKILKEKDLLIENLRKKLANEQQRIRRLKRKVIEKKKVLTPKSKIEAMADDPNQKKELVKKALFGEIIQTQLLDKKVDTNQKTTTTAFKAILSSPLTHKYKIWRLGNKAITYKKMGFNRTKYEAKRNRKGVEKIIQRFYEDDNNSRCAAGKKECITRNKIKKQKRYLLDSLKNLHQKFLKTNLMTVGYAEFCKLRPFWIVVPKLTDRDTCACIAHENINLKLDALKIANVLKFSTYQTALMILCCDRYSEDCLARTCKNCSMKIIPYMEFDNSKKIEVKQWKQVKELIKDLKTKQNRYVTKYKKEIYSFKPRDLITQLEEYDLPKLFQHEQNIVHQYKTIKSLKDSLTEKDAIIHMDFSENYTTKCNKEIQSYHFGGSHSEIETVNKMIKDHEKEQKQFKGTLLVHQVSGNIYYPNKLILKSLSCFCDNVECNHYKLGTIIYQSNTKRLQVQDVFTDSEDDMPLASISQNAQEKSKISYSSGDYVLVKLILNRKEYRYAAVCSKYDDEDGELTVKFLKVSNDTGTEFQLNENDIADVPYEDILHKLPVPKVIVKGGTVCYKFKEPVNVYEK
ncbi:hypothetical protein HW555_001469 [Spodoptera exigua]|uniref:Uncharacterized protein n=1 Tax=Spodoptera exigua TaxID=7107 RepID=A0A835GRW9_SPOEX|nr:hypothetical protein HW555_001469 [Spodoptera exigua]